MRWLSLLILSISLVFMAGCGSNDLEDIEAEEGVIEADTALVDEDGEVYEDVGETDIAASEPVQTTGDVGVYTVKSGDTLMKVAYTLYGDILMWKNLYDLNKDSLNNMNNLEVGSELKYDKPESDPVFERRGEPYRIKNGDTLGTIAYDVYGTQSKWRKLYDNNRQLIKDPDKIYAGFYLYYQITEEERQEAERLKAAGGGQQEISSTDTLPTETTETPVDTGVTPDSGTETGGLDSLAAPPSDERTPSGS